MKEFKKIIINILTGVALFEILNFICNLIQN